MLTSYTFPGKRTGDKEWGRIEEVEDERRQEDGYEEEEHQRSKQPSKKGKDDRIGGKWGKENRAWEQTKRKTGDEREAVGAGEIHSSLGGKKITFLHDKHNRSLSHMLITSKQAQGHKRRRRKTGKLQCRLIFFFLTSWMFYFAT